MRRKTRIALITAGLTLLATLSTAIAVEAMRDVPEEGAFAERRAGDRGEYSLTRLDHQGRVAGSELAFRFEWLPPREIRDWQGAPRVTNPLVVLTPTIQDPLLETFFLDPADLGLDVAKLRLGAEITETDLVPVLPAIASSTASRATESLDLPRVGHESRSLLNCPLVLLPAGSTVRLDEDLRLFEPCRGPDSVVHHPVFRAVRTERLGEHEAIVFEGRTAPTLGITGSSGVWAWIDPALPYPLQVAEENGRETVMHRLVRFERGTEALAVPSAPGEPLEPLEFSVRMPWGMDDAGVDHPWPLSSAWMHARDDPLFSEMRDWLSDHPEAYTARAMGRIIDVGSEREIAWKWVLSDGRDQLTVGHSRIDALVPAMPSPVGGLLSPTPTTTRYTYDNHSMTDEPENFPPSDGLVHPLLPTLASLERHWRAHSGETPLDGWSFSDACYSNTCERQESFRSLGTYHWTGQAVGGSAISVISGWDLDYDVLRVWQPFGGAADPLFLSVVRIQSDDVDLAVAGVALDGQAAEPPQGVARAATAWQPNAPAGIAAVGLLTAIVFLVVRFAIPAAGMPLFSRIESPDLLKHPLRASLHQAIEANPGIHARALARTVGRPRNTVEHHVRKLVDAGLVTRNSLNGHTCLFVKGKVDRRAQGAAGALKAEAARRVLAAVVAKPDASGREVAAHADLAPNLVSYHVQNLVAAGLVATRRDGRTVRLAATDLGFRHGAADQPAVA